MEGKTNFIKPYNYELINIKYSMCLCEESAWRKILQNVIKELQGFFIFFYILPLFIIFYFQSETEKELVGLLGTEAFLSSVFVAKTLTCRTLPEFERADGTAAYEERSSQETSWGEI